MCRKFLPTPNLCNQSNPGKNKQGGGYNPLDLLLDPKRKVEFKKAVAQKKKDFKGGQRIRIYLMGELKRKRKTEQKKERMKDN